jgi:hypothetical protein
MTPRGSDHASSRVTTNGYGKVVAAQDCLISDQAWRTNQRPSPFRGTKHEIMPARRAPIFSKRETEMKGDRKINDPESIRAVGQSRTEPPKRARAIAKITVQASEAEPYDQTTSPALMEIRLSETFTGDIDGQSPVRALQVLRDDHSASLVSVQRFRGRLGGRQGTFVLQGQEIVENGKIKATWFVVPGSGTGDLSGLRGEGFE